MSEHNKGLAALAEALELTPPWDDYTVERILLRAQGWVQAAKGHQARADALQTEVAQWEERVKELEHDRDFREDDSAGRWQRALEAGRQEIREQLKKQTVAPLVVGQSVVRRGGDPTDVGYVERIFMEARVLWGSKDKDRHTCSHAVEALEPAP